MDDKIASFVAGLDFIFFGIIILFISPVVMIGGIVLIPIGIIVCAVSFRSPLKLTSKEKTCAYIGFCILFLIILLFIFYCPSIFTVECLIYNCLPTRCPFLETS